MKLSTLLIDNWREAPKMLSFWAAMLAVAWGSMPPDVQASVLAWLGMPAERIPAVLGVLMLLARLIKQKSTPAPKDPEQ